LIRTASWRFLNYHFEMARLDKAAQSEMLQAKLQGRSRLGRRQPEGLLSHNVFKTW
jgi:hypothetical protein